MSSSVDRFFVVAKKTGAENAPVAMHLDTAITELEIRAASLEDGMKRDPKFYESRWKKLQATLGYLREVRRSCESSSRG